MARIRFLVPVAGMDFSRVPGDLVDMDDEEAAKWADGQRAELVDATPPSGTPQQPEPQEPERQEPERQADADGDQKPTAFDPSEHSNAEVLAYLAEASTEEVLRVLEAEAAGKNRAGIAKQREEVLERARARDAERAAETSRGGGRGQDIETR